MKLQIIAWNMQGEGATTGASSYTKIFTNVLPVLMAQTAADYRIVYLCEAGNPFRVDGKTFKPGAVQFYFDSKTGPLKPNWTLPPGSAVRGTYCPWQKPDSKKPNLRCSVMIMELIKDSGSFSFDFDFLASNSANYGNKRPIAQAGLAPSYAVAISGLHNTANHNPAATELTAVLKYLPVRSSGNCVVGDINVPYPDKQNKVDFNNYLVMAPGVQTQQSGNQLDWGVQNCTAKKNAGADVAKDLCKLSEYEQAKFAGFASSDHEILVYTLTI